jgi:sortase (surface protein transpeptidase)
LWISHHRFDDAKHRFRGLLAQRVHVQRYHVANIKIVNASDLRPLADTEDLSITLVTGYPFYYIGHATPRKR